MEQGVHGKKKKWLQKMDGSYFLDSALKFGGLVVRGSHFGLGGVSHTRLSFFAVLRDIPRANANEIVEKKKKKKKNSSEGYLGTSFIIQAAGFRCLVPLPDKPRNANGKRVLQRYCMIFFLLSI
jgi:hypothetical protein